MTLEEVESGKDKTKTLEHPQVKLSQLLEALSKEETRQELKKQLSAGQMKHQLDAVELKKLRTKDVARDAYVNDLADNLTASWRSRIKSNKLSRIDTMIISDTFEGIFNAPKETKTFDFRILFLLGIGMFLIVSYLWGPAISLWAQTNWVAVDPNIRTALGLFIVLLIVVAIIIVRRRERKP